MTWVELRMNRRDRELLDKQLWGVHSSAPVEGGPLSFAFVAVFLGGLFLGGWLFAHTGSARPHPTDDQMIALFNTNGAPPTTQ
jgi:hypothetical protein